MSWYTKQNTRDLFDDVPLFVEAGVLVRGSNMLRRWVIAPASGAVCFGHGTAVDVAAGGRILALATLKAHAKCVALALHEDGRKPLARGRRRFTFLALAAFATSFHPVWLVVLVATALAAFTRTFAPPGEAGESRPPSVLRFEQLLVDEGPGCE